MRCWLGPPGGTAALVCRPHLSSLPKGEGALRKGAGRWASEGLAAPLAVPAEALVPTLHDLPVALALATVGHGPRRRRESRVRGGEAKAMAQEVDAHSHEKQDD